MAEERKIISTKDENTELVFTTEVAAFSDEDHEAMSKGRLEKLLGEGWTIAVVLLDSPKGIEKEGIGIVPFKKMTPRTAMLYGLQLCEAMVSASKLAHESGELKKGGE